MDTLVWIDSSWVNHNGEPRILLFCRKYNAPEESVIRGVRGFRPYFYVPEGESVFGLDAESDTIIDALGRKVRKVYARLPNHVRELRQRFTWTDEADIPFDMRFVIDVGIQYAFTISNGTLEPVEVKKPLLPRVCYFDIEVLCPEEILPKPENPVYPVISIQALDGYTHEKRIWTLGGERICEEHIVCENEKEVLSRFARYVRQKDFDIITGWYSEGFDVPYLFNRAKILGVSLHEMSRYQNTLKIVGRQFVDMLEMFSKWHKAKGELETYDLKSIAEQFGKFKYIDYGDSIKRLIDSNDWETLVEYGLNDVEALWRIDKEVGLVEFYEYLRYVVGCKFRDTLANSRIIETLILRMKGKPLPTRKYSQLDESDESYKGALVLSPPLGIHEWVGVFDLASLYPSIIIAFDVSPDVDRIIPKVIGKILQEREKLRELRLKGQADEYVKMKETVLKFLANSFYGVMGWKGFRLYDKSKAEFITAKGRELNVLLQKEIQYRGYQPIYGDTDSIFAKEIKTPEEGLQLQEELNGVLRDWARDVGAKVEPKLKFEKLFRRLLFKKKIGSESTAKKRYAGWLIWEDGKVTDEIKIVGMETRRSDSALITKMLLRRVLEAILKESDVLAASKIVGDTIKQFDSLPLQWIAIPKGVRKNEDEYEVTSAWLEGMKNAKQLLGLRFRQDRKPRLLYMKYPVRTLCITEDVERLPDGYMIDRDTMIEKTITQKLRPLLESVGLDWDVIIKGQRTLDEWFIC